jgi:hypothetical protein
VVALAAPDFHIIYVLKGTVQQRLKDIEVHFLQPDIKLMTV